MKHFCNHCAEYTLTINDTDCEECGLSKTNMNLDDKSEGKEEEE